MVSRCGDGGRRPDLQADSRAPNRLIDSRIARYGYQGQIFLPAHFPSSSTKYTDPAKLADMAKAAGYSAVHAEGSDDVFASPISTPGAAPSPARPVAAT